VKFCIGFSSSPAEPSRTSWTIARSALIRSLTGLLMVGSVASVNLSVHAKTSFTPMHLAQNQIQIGGQMGK
jgi:hypothetical protein